MAATAGRRFHDRAACGGAIAQLGERVVRNDEVGGSIPPGSTTLRLRLRVAQPRKSRRRSVVPGVARLGEDGLAASSNPTCTFMLPPAATRGAATQEP